MPHGHVTQLVVFRTTQEPDAFLEGWRPFASSFLSLGITAITLAAFDEDDSGIRYVSRNTWPADAYRRSFPVLPSDTERGGVHVEQAGAYVVRSGDPAREARPGLDLCLALLPADESGPSRVLMDVAGLGAPSAQVVVYQPAPDAARHAGVITAHGPAGTGPSTAGWMRDSWQAAGGGPGLRVLTGREVLTLGG